MEYNRFKAPLYTLLSTGAMHKFPKGQVISAGDDRMTLCMVQSGYVKRYSITSDGTQSIQSIYGPNDVFPLTAVFRALFNVDIYLGSDVFYYESITPLIVHSISKDLLLTQIESDPYLYKDLLYVCGTRLGSNIQRLENMSLRAAQRKVADQLVYYAERFGIENSEGITIQAPLTHQTLANVLNIARETVTICLLSLESKDLIKIDKLITVLDLPGLQNASR